MCQSRISRDDYRVPSKPAIPSRLETLDSARACALWTVSTGTLHAQTTSAFAWTISYAFRAWRRIDCRKPALGIGRASLGNVHFDLLLLLLRRFSAKPSLRPRAMPAATARAMTSLISPAGPISKLNSLRIRCAFSRSSAVGCSGMRSLCLEWRADTSRPRALIKFIVSVVDKENA